MWRRGRLGRWWASVGGYSAHHCYTWWGGCQPPSSIGPRTQVLVEAERLRPGLEVLLAEADYVVTSAHFPQDWTGEGGALGVAGPGKSGCACGVRRGGVRAAWLRAMERKLVEQVPAGGDTVTRVSA